MGPDQTLPYERLCQLAMAFGSRAADQPGNGYDLPSGVRGPDFTLLCGLMELEGRSPNYQVLLV